ncbi:MAG TPA: hypothetical protein VN764_15070 [Polyangiaceae bacterium]|nr:hypothetical protein [Polyangiaceae bacterium]
MRAAACLALTFLLLEACGAPASHRAAASPAEHSRLHYTIPTVSGGPIDTMAHRGRATVLLFVTTFDVLSQSQASRLEDFYRSHEPRINAAAVVMEPPRNWELVQSFAKVLALSYSVGMADHQELSRQGLLGEINTVPAWLVLDADGRVSASGVGTLSITQLKRAVTQAQR